MFRVSHRYRAPLSWAVAGLVASCQGTDSAQNDPDISDPLPPPPPPNIVIILADDHSTAALGCYGSELVRTPNLDALAAEGMAFDRAYSGNAICAPARATLITGLHSHAHGVMTNAESFDGSQWTLQQALRDEGYETALVGKWHLKSSPTGFDHWCVLPGQGHYYDPEWIDATGRHRSGGHVTNVTTEKAVDWLRGREGDEPFCLMVHHKAPHRNWLPAPEDLDAVKLEDIPLPETLFDDYATRSDAARQQEMSIAHHMRDREDMMLIPEDDVENSGTLRRMDAEQRAAWFARFGPENEAFAAANLEGEELVAWKTRRYLADYLRCIAGIDRSVGTLCDTLEELELDENTLVVYISDQGFFLGEHGWYDKRFFYEPSARIPLLMRFPKGIEAGARNDTLVSNVDFAPTILDFVGAEHPGHFHGTSFVAAAQGRSNGEEPAREEVYAHYLEYPGVHAVKRNYGVRTDRHKLIHYYHDIDAWELFDLELDPEELVNRYDDPDYAEVREDLTARIRGIQSRIDDDPIRYLRGLETIRLSHAAKGVAVHCETPPDSQYAVDADKVLTDGVLRGKVAASDTGFEGWLGFREEACRLSMDLGEARVLNSTRIHVLDHRGAWIHPPSGASFEVSVDGEDWTTISATRDDAVPGEDATGTAWFRGELPGTPIRYLRAELLPVDPIDLGSPGTGNRAWIFIDEWAVQ